MFIHLTLEVFVPSKQPGYLTTLAMSILTKNGITGEYTCLCVNSDHLSVFSTNLRLQFSLFVPILLNVMSPWNKVHFPSSSSQHSSNVTISTTDLAVAVNINLLLIPKVFSNLSYRSPPISKQLQIRAQSGGRGRPILVNVISEEHLEGIWEKHILGLKSRIFTKSTILFDILMPHRPKLWSYDI